MNFTFSKNAYISNPNDPIYHLGHQLESLDNKELSPTSPTKQLALLYNDAKNYIMSKLTPMAEWYEKRIKMIQEYAELDWLGLGEHLNKKSKNLGNLCATIHYKLQQLLEQQEQSLTAFNITLFCTVLSKIDHLWHIILPSHLENIQSPTIITLLSHCGQLSYRK